MVAKPEMNLVALDRLSTTIIIIISIATARVEISMVDAMVERTMTVGGIAATRMIVVIIAEVVAMVKVIATATTDHIIITTTIIAMIHKSAMKPTTLNMGQLVTRTFNPMFALE